MSQPSPVSAKPEAHATLAIKKAEPQTTPTKAEPTSEATKSQPAPAAIKAIPTVLTPKANTEPTSVTTETMATAACAQIELKTTVIPTTARDSPVTTEKQLLAASTAEPNITTMAPLQETAVIPNVEVPNTDLPKTVTVRDKEEEVKMELSVTGRPKIEESKPSFKVEAGITVASSSPVTETTFVPTFPVAAEVAMAGVVQSTDKQPELSTPERIIKEVQPDDHIKLTEPTKSLQQVEVQPKSQEPQLDAKPVTVADSKDMASKMVEEIIDITSSPETQPVSTKNIIIKVRMGPLKYIQYIVYIACIDKCLNQIVQKKTYNLYTI